MSSWEGGVGPSIKVFTNLKQRDEVTGEGEWGRETDNGESFGIGDEK
jgi:hypothetical protein